MNIKYRKENNDSRRPPAPHKNWPFWAANKAYRLRSISNTNIKHRDISKRIATVLSGAKGGVEVTVPIETVGSWIRREEKKAQMQQQRQIDG